MILNRRTLLASIGLTLSAATAAEAASATHTTKKKPTHTHAIKASSPKTTHHKSHATPLS